MSRRGDREGRGGGNAFADVVLPVLGVVAAAGAVAAGLALVKEAVDSVAGEAQDDLQRHQRERERERERRPPPAAAAAAPSPTRQPPRFKVGDRAVTRGLVTNAELNGLIVHVDEWDDADERFVVTGLRGQRLKVRAANLAPLEDTAAKQASGGGGSDGPASLECFLCAENRKDRALECGHAFCAACVGRLLESPGPCCPECRTPILRAPIKLYL